VFAFYPQFALKRSEPTVTAIAQVR
jgi:hypothetical protein